MERNASLQRVKRVGTGLCFVVFPLLFVFAFAVHPGLLQPHVLDPEAMILRAHGDGLLQFGHVLVTVSTALLVVVALHFMSLLARTAWAWAGLVGAAVGILGAIALAVDKRALCLTMSALDTLPAGKFAAMMPGLLAMYSHKAGWCCRGASCSCPWASRSSTSPCSRRGRSLAGRAPCSWRA
jgi:hypothetical protein